MSEDNNMEDYYSANSKHYDTGLMKLGCSEQQARGYAKYFRQFVRENYYRQVVTSAERIRGDSDKLITILDVGCGLGEDIRALNSRIPNAEFIGVEISETAIRICNETKNDNTDFFVGSLDSVTQLNGRQFDLVINFCVIEHVADPQNFIMKCAQYVKENGIAIFAFPNHIYWLTWDWLFYYGRILSLKISNTHSVRREIVKRGIFSSGMTIDTHNIRGFRPPQPFFRYIPDMQFERFIRLLPKAENALIRLGLESILYLEIYVCMKKMRTIGVAEAKHIKKNFPCLSGLITIFLCYLFWWSLRLIHVFTRMLRKIRPK